jgi:CBS domain containing-hemolysin-like protein
MLYNSLTMTIFLMLLAVVVFFCLLLATAMQPLRSQYSLAELKRRAKHSEAFVLELDRHELYPALTTLLRSVRAVLIVLVVCLSIGVFGWWLGIVLALVVAVVYPSLARLPFIKKLAKKIYASLEHGLLDFVVRFERLLHGFREPSATSDKPAEVHSLEDLTELVERSKEAIGERERRLLVSALQFPTKTVAEIMTPRANIDYIKSSEFLGPLVLDELHKLGHGRLVVIEKDLDSIVGILHLRDLLSLDVKQSSSAEQVMDKKVFAIAPEVTLEEAFRSFVKHRCSLLIVRDEDSNTVGLVTLDDLCIQLLGYPASV